MSVRHTDNALYTVTRKEILTSALPGRPPKQAPRYPSVLLAAFEVLVMDPEAKQYWRIMGWWLLLQAWGALRFDDHRGLLPADVVVDQGGLTAKLSHTKVSGPDKKVVYRIVVVDSAAYLQHKEWDSDWLEHIMRGSAVRKRLHASHADKQSQGMQMRRTSVPHCVCHPVADHCAFYVLGAKNFLVGDAPLLHSTQRAKLPSQCGSSPELY